MKIYNQDKTEILNDIDLELGYLADDKRLVRHVDAVEGHTEYIEHTYYDENGKVFGVSKSIDEEKSTSSQPAYDEYEDIKVFVPFSEEQLKQNKIDQLQERLTELSRDIVQIYAGAQFDDSEARVREFRDIHNLLRELLGKEPRIYTN